VGKDTIDVAQTPFQAWLNEELRERGWSGEELARRINVTGSAIGRWRRGEAMPRREHVPALARELGLREEQVMRLTMGDTERQRRDDEIAAYLSYQLPERTTIAEARLLVMMAQTFRRWQEEMRDQRAGQGAAKPESDVTGREVP
jgi:transcriptional regulator with XRE-family HTH domain